MFWRHQAVLVFYCRHSTAPPYLSAELTRVANSDFDHQTWWRLSFRGCSTRQLVIMRFQSRRHESETVSHLSSHHLHRCKYSSRDWRQSSSHACTLPLNTEQTYVMSNWRTSLVFILSRDLEVPWNYMSWLMSLVYNNYNVSTQLMRDNVHPNVPLEHRQLCWQCASLECLHLAHPPQLPHDDDVFQT